MNQANTQHFQQIPFRLPPSRLPAAEFGHESCGEGAVKTDFRRRARGASVSLKGQKVSEALRRILVLFKQIWSQEILVGHKGNPVSYYDSANSSSRISMRNDPADVCLPAVFELFIVN